MRSASFRHATRRTTPPAWAIPCSSSGNRGPVSPSVHITTRAVFIIASYQIVFSGRRRGGRRARDPGTRCLDGVAPPETPGPATDPSRPPPARMARHPRRERPERLTGQRGGRRTAGAPGGGTVRYTRRGSAPHPRASPPPRSPAEFTALRTQIDDPVGGFD